MEESSHINIILKIELLYTSIISIVGGFIFEPVDICFSKICKIMSASI